MAEYSVVNLVAGLVGVGVLGTGYLLVSREREALSLFGLLVAVGAGLLFVAVTPDSFALVAGLLGLEFKTHAILVVANLVLFALVTYLLYRVGRLYDRLSRLNEAVGLLQSRVDQVEGPEGRARGREPDPEPDGGREREG